MSRGLIGRLVVWTVLLWVVACGVPRSEAVCTPGVLAETHGGTCQSAYTTGDLLAASATNTLARVADVAAGSYLRSGGVGVVPGWSTVTLPNTTTMNQLLFSSATNVVAGLATSTNAVLVTDGTGVPSLSTTIPSATQDNITRTGTLVSGTTGAGFTVALSTSTITGTLADARLSANVPLLNAGNVFSTTNQFTKVGVGILPVAAAYLQVKTGTDLDVIVRQGADFGASYSGVALDSVNDASNVRNMLVLAGTPVVLFGKPQFAGTNTTAAVAGAIGSTCPAVTCTAAYTWVQGIAADGSTIYFPVWK